MSPGSAWMSSRAGFSLAWGIPQQDPSASSTEQRAGGSRRLHPLHYLGRKAVRGDTWWVPVTHIFFATGDAMRVHL